MFDCQTNDRGWVLYSFEGKELTIGQLAQIAWDRYGNCIHPQTLRSRIKKGMPIDEALMLRHKHDRYFFNGEWCRMSDLKRMAKEKGINLPVPTILSRIKRGWSLEETISKPPLQKKRFKYYCYKGRKYTIKELAKIAFVSYHTMRVAIRKNPHLSIEQIINSFLGR